MNNDVLRPASLRLFRPGGVPTVVALTGDPLTIGRSTENGLVIDDGTVSRKHAEVVATPQGHLFRDRKSTRGSFVNMQPVVERLLQPGDVITLGHPEGIRLVYEVEGINDGAALLDESSRPSVLNIIRPENSRYLNTRTLDLAALRKGPALDRLKALYEITTVTLSARSVDDLCRNLMMHLCGVLTCERGWILLRQEGSGALQVVAEKARIAGADASQPSQTIVSRVLAENVAILSADTMADARFAEQHSIAGQAVRSVVCAPISSADHSWGVVYFDTRTAGMAFDPEQLEFLMAACRQAGIALENLYLVQEQKRALESFISSLTAAIDARDELTAGHSARVANNAGAFAAYLGRSAEAVRLVQIAGLLHDVGKIGTQDSVLQKPGRLTADEFEHMKQHPRNADRILSRIRLPEDLRELPAIAAAHHENLDGTGYPAGLKGQQVPDLARLISIADVFDALTSKRHYRDPMTLDETLKIIDEMAGSKFDPELVAAFKRFVQEGRWISDASYQG